MFLKSNGLIVSELWLTLEVANIFAPCQIEGSSSPGFESDPKQCKKHEINIGIFDHDYGPLVVGPSVLAPTQIEIFSRQSFELHLKPYINQHLIMKKISAKIGPTITNSFYTSADEISLGPHSY